MANRTSLQWDPEHFALRLLQDCLNEATVGYWLHRARQFDDCNPDIAAACRNKAHFVATYATDEPSEEVLATWE